MLCMPPVPNPHATELKPTHYQWGLCTSTRQSFDFLCIENVSPSYVLAAGDAPSDTVAESCCGESVYSPTRLPTEQL